MSKRRLLQLAVAGFVVLMVGVPTGIFDGQHGDRDVRVNARPAPPAPSCQSFTNGQGGGWICER
jgi:hypothetical protein